MLLRHYALADALRLPILLFSAGAAFRYDTVQRRHCRQYIANQILARDFLVAVSASLLLSTVHATAVDAVDIVLQSDLENAVRVVPMLLLRMHLVFRGGRRSDWPQRNHGVSLQTVTGTIAARLEARAKRGAKWVYVA